MFSIGELFLVFGFIVVVYVSRARVVRLTTSPRYPLLSEYSYG